MSSSAAETVIRARRVRVTRHELIVELEDGRTIKVPLEWFPRLLHGTDRQRREWKFLGDGEGIRWPSLDEDLTVAGLLRGTARSAAPGNGQRSRPTHRRASRAAKKRARSVR